MVWIGLLIIIIDFFDFYFNEFHWPAFNFAGSFITVGGIIF